MDQELQGRGLGQGFIHARIDPQAGPVGDRLRVRAWVGRVVPLAFQPFNPAFQGQGLTFPPPRSSSVPTVHLTPPTTLAAWPMQPDKPSRGPPPLG